jgi:uncharacterized protein YutE (UPF0331/DUF86 family)
MNDPMILARKLALLREHSDRAKRRRPNDIDELSNDLDRQDALALSVIVIVQEAIDIAFHIATDQGWGLPASYAESFEILARHGVIDSKLATSLGSAARLRNRIAHGYATLDVERLWNELPQGLAAFEQFAAALANWLGQR